ncbi:hypothetical protein K501DRAFT_153239, partial [Backusella circina FSU 941]
LVPKRPFNTFSPLFHDPDLLMELAGGNVQFLTGRSSTSRRRDLQQALTTSRPQAKDVSSNRVHDDADIDDSTVLNGFYHHPKGPKKRMYIAESEDSSPHGASPEEDTL